MEIETETAQFPEEEYINGIFRCSVPEVGPSMRYDADTPAGPGQ
jgi:hypothetical protein